MMKNPGLQTGALFIDYGDWRNVRNWCQCKTLSGCYLRRKEFPLGRTKITHDVPHTPKYSPAGCATLCPDG